MSSDPEVSSRAKHLTFTVDEKVKIYRSITVTEGEANSPRLSDFEQQAICDVTHSERFADLSVREIYATLLDEGIYLGSISTMYRVLRRAGET